MQLKRRSSCGQIMRTRNWFGHPHISGLYLTLIMICSMAFQYCKKIKFIVKVLFGILINFRCPGFLCVDAEKTLFVDRCAWLLARDGRWCAMTCDVSRNDNVLGQLAGNIKCGNLCFSTRI